MSALLSLLELVDILLVRMDLLAARVLGTVVARKDLRQMVLAVVSSTVLELVRQLA